MIAIERDPHLGKRIVLIEGAKASLDKQTYGSIVGAQYPELVLVPVGGKESIDAFARAFETVLNKTVWGVEFFMLCDGDTAQNSSDVGGRLRRLPRYHIENYFLDEHVLAKIFESLEEPDGSWLRDPTRIREEIRRIARANLSYAVALNVSHRLRMAVGNVDLMPPKCHDKTVVDLGTLFETRRSAEVSRVLAGLEQGRVKGEVEAEYSQLVDLLDRDDPAWLARIPGKPVLGQFASKTPLDVPRMKRLYLKFSAQMTVDPFEEVRGIFRGFSSFGAV